MTDPVRRVSCGAAAWGSRARRAGQWASLGAHPAHVCASGDLPAAGRASRGREVPGRQQDPPRPASGAPPPSLPAAPRSAGSTVLKGCLEKQALRGERRGSDLRSGGRKIKGPHRALPTGSAWESPSALTRRPSELSGPQRPDLGRRTGVRTSSPPGAEEEGSQAGTGRRAGGGAARVLGHRVPVPACPASGTRSSAWRRSFTLHGHAPER